MQSPGPMVSIHTAVTALLLGIGLTTARADTNADAFVAHQVATQTFEADLRQVFHWSFPRKHVESLGHISTRPAATRGTPTRGSTPILFSARSMAANSVTRVRKFTNCRSIRENKPHHLPNR